MGGGGGGGRRERNETDNKDYILVGEIKKFLGPEHNIMQVLQIYVNFWRHLYQTR